MKKKKLSIVMKINLIINKDYLKIKFEKRKKLEIIKIKIKLI